MLFIYFIISFFAQQLFSFKILKALQMICSLLISLSLFVKTTCKDLKLNENYNIYNLVCKIESSKQL